MSFRISVVGTSCSGKTTLARNLGKILGLPVTDLDDLFWTPGWKPRGEEEFQKLAMEASSGENWVIAGNYTRIQTKIWPRATHVLWLNYSFPRVFYQGLQRTLVRSWTGELCCNGNRESLKISFLSKESILLWIIQDYSRQKAKYIRAKADPVWARLKFLEFRKPGETKVFLNGNLQKALGTGT